VTAYAGRVEQQPTHVVGIGASAGGVDALIELVGRIPLGLDAAFCIVLHVPATGRSVLAAILARRTELPVEVAQDGEALRAGRVYVAPPDRHLTVDDGRVLLTRGPKENGVRPAVDPMLRSLAAAYGERAVAVVLSGALGDGRSGALAVSQAGGAVIVQDPEEATVPSMPGSALAAVGDTAAILPAAGIGPALADLATGVPMREDTAMHAPRDPSEHADRPAGPPSAFTCPECSGPLWETEHGGVLRFRCRVGHGFTEDALVGEQGTAVEAALWIALESLEERAEFLRRIADRHADDRPRMRARYEGAASDALERAELIRTALGIGGGHPHALDLPAVAAE
jgi:two-component system, chemotaxis family, protein-glutamate methylesterase/glutaminase